MDLDIFFRMLLGLSAAPEWNGKPGTV